jgi:hypothetical protein
MESIISSDSRTEAGAQPDELPHAEDDEEEDEDEESVEDAIGDRMIHAEDGEEVEEEAARPGAEGAPEAVDQEIDDAEIEGPLRLDEAEEVGLPGGLLAGEAEGGKEIDRSEEDRGADGEGEEAAVVQGTRGGG